MSDLAEHDRATPSPDGGGGRGFEGLLVEIRYVPLRPVPAPAAPRQRAERAPGHLYAAIFVHDIWLGAADRHARAWLLADAARSRVDDEIAAGQAPAFLASDPRYLLAVLTQMAGVVLTAAYDGAASPVCIVYTDPDEVEALQAALAPASVHLRVAVAQGHAAGTWRVSTHDPVSGAERDTALLAPLSAAERAATDEERHELLESYESWQTAAAETAAADQRDAEYADARAALVGAWAGAEWAAALRALYASEAYQL